MTLDEYEQTGQALYADFAHTIESILRAALIANGSVRFQAIQRRAKDTSEVRKKLNGADASIEASVKDLAGARIVVYSNSDVVRLNQFEILRGNFEIVWERTKFHYPNSSGEVDQSQFVGHNYVVRLNESRAALPEYRRFAGLQCEVQVQTILDHAWSETAHDTIYKSPSLNGVGAAQLAKIKERMRDVQQKYLRRAGYEFQQILNDFEHIVSGQRLVDSDILAAIRDASDNNVRVELLEQYETVVLPIIDDKAAAAPEIRSMLIEAARNTHSLAVAPRETSYGSMSGLTHEDVIEKIISILAHIQYVEPAEAYLAFASLYLVFDEPELKQKILDAVGELARHALPVWRRFGPAMQEVLLDAVSATPNEHLVSTRPLMIEVLGKCLKSEVTGTSRILQCSHLGDRCSCGLRSPAHRAQSRNGHAQGYVQVVAEQSAKARKLVIKQCIPLPVCHLREHMQDTLLERALADTASVSAFLAEQSEKLSGSLKSEGGTRRPTPLSSRQRNVGESR